MILGGCSEGSEEEAMGGRTNFVVDPAEKERYRRQAAREGKGLSEWLRDAARDKLAAVESGPVLDRLEELRAFFRACDQHEQGREPGWDEHLRVIEASIGSGRGAA
jgi:hypothetical protein